jgi:hypothetical protein
VSWFFRPDKWPRTPEQWIDAATSFPVTPREWLAVADDLRRSPTRMFLDVIRGVAQNLKGREIEIRSGDSDVVLVLDAVRADHDPSPLGPVRAGLDVEVIDELDIDVRDVRWDAGSIDRLRIEVRNVVLEPGVPAATVVAKPIELIAEIDQPTFDRWLARAADDLLVSLDAVGRATVRPVKWQRWVAAEVRPRLDGAQIHVDVERIKVGPFRFRRLPRVPERHTIDLPEFDRDLRVTDIEVAPGLLRVRGHIPEWREAIQLEHLIRAAGTVGQHVVFNRA